MNWVRSSRCHTSSCCVEVAIMSAVEANEWTKSSRSTDISSCVEVQWRKSSFSNNGGQCVEVGVWQTSSLTDNSGPWCVEVAGETDGGVLVRDTKDKGDGPVLRYTRAEWSAFIGGVKLNEFDLPED